MLFNENIRECGWENSCKGIKLKWLYPPQRLQQGDILETPTVLSKNFSLAPRLVIPFITHYGIYFIKDGKGYVAHNPAIKQPMITPIEDFQKERTIYRIARTNLTTDEILKKFDQVKNKHYSFALYNCEDFLRTFCSCGPVFDQRLKGIIILIILFILLYLILKK